MGNIFMLQKVKDNLNYCLMRCILNIFNKLFKNVLNTKPIIWFAYSQTFNRSVQF